MADLHEYDEPDTEYDNLLNSLRKYKKLVSAAIVKTRPTDIVTQWKKTSREILSRLDAERRTPKYRRADDYKGIRLTQYGREADVDNLFLSSSTPFEAAAASSASLSVPHTRLSLDLKFKEEERIKLKNLVQGSEEWGKKRISFYSGSTASYRSFVNSNFRSWLYQFAQDLQLLEQADLSTKPAVQKGVRYENFVRTRFIDGLKKQFGKDNVLVWVGGIHVPSDEDFHFIGYSPDGVITVRHEDYLRKSGDDVSTNVIIPDTSLDKTHPYTSYNFELKLPWRSVYTQIYENYMAQVQLGMFTLDERPKKTLFVSSFVDPSSSPESPIIRDTTLFTVDRNCTFLESLIRRGIYYIACQQTYTIPSDEILNNDRLGKLVHKDVHYTVSKPQF